MKEGKHMGYIILIFIILVIIIAIIQKLFTKMEIQILNRLYYFYVRIIEKDTRTYKEFIQDIMDDDNEVDEK